MTTTTKQRPIDRAAEMPTERLEAELVTLGYRMARNTADLLVLIGEFDHRGTWALFGSLSCAAWLADTLELDIATARTQVRVARAMRKHSALGDAVTDRRLSYAKARVLVPHLTDDNAADLVELAERHAAGSLGAAIAAWSARHEGEQERDERHHRERRLSWRTDGDGMVVFTMRLPPADAGKLMAVIDQVVMTTPPSHKRFGPTPGQLPTNHEDAPAGASDRAPSSRNGSSAATGPAADSGQSEDAPAGASSRPPDAASRSSDSAVSADVSDKKDDAPAGASSSRRDRSDGSGDSTASGAEPADGQAEWAAAQPGTRGESTMRTADCADRTPDPRSKRQWDPPSLAQQRADALIRIATGEVGRTSTNDRSAKGPSLPANGRSDKVPNASETRRPEHRSRLGQAPATVDVVAEMVIHVRGDGNTLADGTPISDHAVTSMLPGSFVSLLRKDMAGRPIDASPRRRTPTRRQRRVIDEAHPTCAHPGCNARMFLEYDHIQPYAEGGPTVVDNLRRLCGPHNRARNDR